MRAFTENDDERVPYYMMCDALRDHWDEKAIRLLGAAMALFLGSGSYTDDASRRRPGVVSPSNWE
jgi:hypothetical protein